jgi:NADPH:quinone reductase-like Zn-dependent oxidoreductase
MKAIVVEQRGDAGSLVEIPVPTPGADEILVRVKVAGVNPIDWKRRDRGDRPVPFVMGQDFAGIVSATGDRVTKYREGERICGMAPVHGAFAEYTIVPEEGVGQPIARIPDDVSDADAAALPTAGLAALASVAWLQVSSGTVLVVLGATGGLGGFAVQIARIRGARIIGSGRSTNEPAARSIGVDSFIAYDRENAVDAIRSSQPNGVDAVLDLVDDSNGIKAMADVLREGGKIVSTIGAVDVQWFEQRRIAAWNLNMRTSPEVSNAGLLQLLEFVERGQMVTRIVGTHPLADAVSALDDSKHGRISGKLVITVD